MSVFDAYHEPTTTKYEEVGFNSALPNELEKDIFNSLKDKLYLSQISEMLANYQETGYMTFRINFKDLSDSLQVFLHKDDSFYQFLRAAQNVIKYLIYISEPEYIEENIVNVYDVITYKDICEHIPTITVRIRNFDYDLSVPDISKCIPIRAAKAASMKRLKAFKGIVVAINQSTMDLVKMEMICNNGDCGQVHIISFNEMEKLGRIGKCPTCGEGELIMTKEETQDVQILTLHDMNDAKSFATSVQASLKCIVNQDLTDKVEIGDSVIVTGLPRADLDDKRSRELWNAKVKNNDYYMQMDAFRPRTGGVPFPKCLDVNYIEVNDADDFSNFKGKIEQIKELQKREDLYELLIKSFCPQIYGHEFIKEGLLLALVGGIGRNTTGGKVDKRGNIHAMMISDPSVGKSEILKYCAKLMKRGIFVSATSSTKVGLTGAAVRDEVTGKWMIEAGAILRANNGILCIDEVGHLSKEDQAALLEVAEQEQYTFNKAGILKTFPVNIVLIVSGNPIDGRYNPDMTAAQNLGQFAAPFLSRFDEKYVFRDIPDEENDENIMGHVLKQVNGQFDTTGLIPFDLLAAYISYVRTCGITPKLTDAAIERIKKWYSGKRKGVDVNDMTKPAPIGVREGEGVTRMCFAKARLLNQEIIDVEDVDKIIAIHDQMIYKVAYDPKSGMVDTQNYNGGKTAFSASIDVKVMGKIEKMTEDNDSDRLDLMTFFSACKVNKIGSKQEIRNSLETFARIGKIKLTESYLELL
jgi:replicative DNA helicase Mcm